MNLYHLLKHEENRVSGQPFIPVSGRVQINIKYFPTIYVICVYTAMSCRHNYQIYTQNGKNILHMVYKRHFG